LDPSGHRLFGGRDLHERGEEGLRLEVQRDRLPTLRQAEGQKKKRQKRGRSISRPHWVQRQQREQQKRIQRRVHQERLRSSSCR